MRKRVEWFSKIIHQRLDREPLPRPGVFNLRKMREIKYEIISECWVCTSHKPNADGYPSTKINRKNCRIGRLFYERFKGPIPNNEIVRHTCDNRKCINPDHLILGTHKENMRDMAERGRAPFGRNHHNVKLCESQVLEIRQNKTDSMMTLAQKYGVSKTQVWKIKHRVNWRRVDLTRDDIEFMTISNTVPHEV